MIVTVSSMGNSSKFSQALSNVENNFKEKVFVRRVS